MQTHIDRLKRERDATKDKDEKRRIKLEIIRLLRKRDDKRSSALHVWTHRLVARSGDLTVIKPDLTEARRDTARQPAGLGSQHRDRQRSKPHGAAVVPRHGDSNAELQGGG